MQRATICLVGLAWFALFVPAGARDASISSLRAAVPQSGTIHPRVEAWAEAAPEGSRVWILLSDHGSAAGTYVPISERARERRLRRGVPLFTADRQPVAPEYLAAVRAAGARVHRVSRWLNAISVAYDPLLVEHLARLPFVVRINPVQRFARLPVEPCADAARTPVAGVSAASGLDYGGSLAQIQQIAADLAHARGYSGSGALVAMFDTGFRKDHVAFQAAIAEGRLLAEWDFVFDDGEVGNEPEDLLSAHYHGTSTWSVLGGAYPGQLYGPAYGASFVLAKTEDIRSETPVEEDNWLAAVEWVDSLGADVISSSLSYSDWYVASDYDGRTAVTTLAADLAASLGIVVCNSAGNAGPTSPSIGAPVDAFNILGVGSVTATGEISSFSSRGPTWDGRIKPEVCARGSATYLASASTTTAFGSGNGTSFSCPLVGGCAAILIEAHPDWNPLQVREALMQTASRAAIPDNTYGWGIVNVDRALDYAGSVVVTAEAPPDTLVTYAPEIAVRARVSTLSAPDADASTVYYREAGGTFTGLPVTLIAPDTLVAALPRPGVFQTTLEYYFRAQDTVGFSGRAPESTGTAFSFVFQAWLPGDLDRNLVVNSADLLFLVNYVFRSGAAPDPQAMGEIDGTGGITAADAIYLVNYLFKSGPEPVLPS